MNQTLLRIKKGFEALLLKHTCIGCERSLLAQEKWLCFYCLSQIPETHFHLSPCKNELFYRLGGKVDIQGACSLFFFDKKGSLQKVMEQLKYKNLPQLGFFLGKYYGAKLLGTPFVKDLDLIVPIPLHVRKKILRGYNQAELISEGLSQVLEIPVGRKYVKRKRFTATQTRKKGLERWQNVANAFEIRKSLPKSVLVVDDIVTTGATLESCIRTLQGNPMKSPEELRVLSIGMARKN